MALSPCSKTTGGSGGGGVDKYQKRFPRRAVQGLAVAELLLGLAGIASHVALLLLDQLGIGEGFFCGVLFLAAGLAGLASVHKSSACKISAFMVLNILASVFSAILLVVSSVRVVIARHEVYDEDDHSYRATQALCSCLITVALAEGIPSHLN